MTRTSKKTLTVIVVTNPQLHENHRWREALEPLVDDVLIVGDIQAAEEILRHNPDVGLLVINAFASRVPASIGRQWTGEAERFLAEQTTGLSADIVVVTEGSFEIQLRFIAAFPFPGVTVISKSGFFEEVGRLLPPAVLK
jgi:hypothetical protein